jgi:hypothetical protein
MFEYLSVFIFDFFIGVIFTIVLPFFMYIVIKDIRVKKQIGNRNLSYLYTSNSLSKTKIIFFCFSQVVLVIFIVFYLIDVQIPIFRDIPSLITGNMVSIDARVNEVEHHKYYSKIYINNEEIEEHTWFKSSIEPYYRYNIIYLQHSKYIIKAKKIDKYPPK